MRRLSILSLAVILPAALWLTCGGVGCSREDDGATPVPSANMSIRAGFWNKTHVECDPGEQKVPLLHLLISKGGGATVTVENVTFRTTGTIADDSDVLAVYLALDMNGDGKYTGAADIDLTPLPQAFDADDGTVTFSINRQIPPHTAESWVLAADLSGSAATGTHMQVSLASASDVTARDSGSGGLVAVSGPPVSGGRVSIPSPVLSWSALSPGGAGPVRYGHSAVHDPPGNRMVVFGGTDGTNSYNDLFALDLTDGAETWSSIVPSGPNPAARNQHRAVFDPGGGRMVLFGGADAATVYNDVWFLTLGAGSETWSAPAVSGSPPPGRFAPLMVFLAGSGKILVNGGNGAMAVNPHLSDFFELDPAPASPIWSAVTATVPSNYSQSGHVGFFDAPGNRVVQFGGLVNPGNSTNNLYALDRASSPPALTLLNAGGGPFPAAWAAGARDPVSGRFYLWGGFESTTGVTLGDLYAFDPAPPSPGRWIYIMALGVAPTPRCHHSMIFDPVQNRMILFGGAQWGSGSWVPLGDVWELR